MANVQPTSPSSPNLAEDMANAVKRILDNISQSYKTQTSALSILTEAQQRVTEGVLEYIKTITSSGDSVDSITKKLETFRSALDGSSISTAKLLELEKRHAANLLKLADLRDALTAAEKTGSEQQIAITKTTYEKMKAIAFKTAEELSKADPTKDLAEMYGKIEGATFRASAKTKILTDKLTALGIPIPGAVTKIKTLTDAFGTFGVKGAAAGAVAAGLASVGIAIVTALKELFRFAGDASQNINLLVKSGGTLNNTWDTAIDMTMAMQSAWVDNVETQRLLNSFTDEYGMMLNDMISTVDKNTGAISISESKYHDMNVAIAGTGRQLAKMGPMFGMTAEQTGKIMGELSARFHLTAEQTGTAFERLGLIARGSGIQFTAWASILKRAGDNLRWVRTDMDVVTARFVALAIHMKGMADKAGDFWRKLQPGEMLSIMDAVVEGWRKMTLPQYLALKPGAASMSIEDLATGYKQFLEAEPIEAFKMAVDRYVDIFSKQGYGRDTAQLIASQAPMFAEFGRMAPRLVQVLNEMPKAQYEQIRKSGDMNVLFDALIQRFPQQTADIERLRETQLMLGDPLQVVARMIIRIYRLMAGSIVPGLTKVTEATLGSVQEDAAYYKRLLAGPEQSAAGTALHKSRVLYK